MTESKRPTDVAEVDAGKGAVEGDRPDARPQQGNPHGSGLDERGLPKDETAICEDVIGANVDETQG
ncbi:MAG TPA: hypothetical protein VH740_09565 [Vicinamibacterales bacterium]|jgi:hypothetical protein